MSAHEACDNDVPAKSDVIAIEQHACKSHLRSVNKTCDTEKEQESSKNANRSAGEHHWTTTPFVDKHRTDCRRDQLWSRYQTQREEFRVGKADLAKDRCNEKALVCDS